MTAAPLQSPLEMFLHWEQHTPDALFLNQATATGWKTWTYREAGDTIRRAANALRSFNFASNGKIALLSKNCAHWIMADLAIWMAGYISVPIYPTSSAKTIQFILEHSESSLIIIGKLDEYEQQRVGIPENLPRLCFSHYGIQDGDDFDNIAAQHEPLTNVIKRPLGDLATIMYTSGTSGIPKGVMLSGFAMSFTAANAISFLRLPSHPRMFSYLPLSHVAERIGIEVVGIFSGASFSFAHSLESFPSDLATTQPNIFFAVPRIWAKFQEKILEKIPQKKLTLLLSIPVISSIVKKSIRKKLGLAKASHIYVGAAPIAESLLRWYDALGIVIFQAYAMTENCCYGTFNRHGENKYGTVGKVLPHMEIKISNESEILIKHPAMMMGYFKDEEQTAQSFDNDFYKTGDMGEISKDGYLTITGRLKDQFKTDKGKYISPSPIELKVAINTDIEKVCVVGMGIPQPIALVVLTESAKEKSKEVLNASLEATLREVNNSLDSHEKVEKMVIVRDDWSIENNLMTPSLKIKRNEVEKIYVNRYPAWYAADGKIIHE